MPNDRRSVDHEPGDRETARARLLFGTDEPVNAPRLLRAGALSAEWTSGALRNIRWGGTEVLRVLAFVVRDTRWGTYIPTLTGIALREEADRFTIAYDGVLASHDGQFGYSVTVAGSADGRLRIEATGRSPDGFSTNRTGFVVLHPLEGVAGQPLEVGHPDGSTTRTVFPKLVMPDQPATAIAQIRHAPATGVTVALRFEGDVFEMEDHRNWTDASFKTYVRPLSRGFPYRIEAGETLSQAIDLVVRGPATVAQLESNLPVTVRWGDDTDAVMPALGLYADTSVLADPVEAAEVAEASGPNYLHVRVDLREEAKAIELLGDALRIARLCTCPLHLDAVIAGETPATELATLADWMARAAPDVGVLFIVPARDLRSRPAESVPNGQAGMEAILAAARVLFPGVRLAGGMPVGFPELNRNRPPADIDWIVHATQAVVHAADDRSVMETLDALPHIVATTRAIVGGCPYRIGPATIGMVPSASAAPPVETTGRQRVAMNARDPRQTGLFAAAFLLGTVAATDDVQAITPATPTGDFGLVNRDGRARPVAAVFTALARRVGRPRLGATHAVPGRLATLAIETEVGPELWVANLTGAPIDLRLEGPVVGTALVIDADRLSGAAADALAEEPMHSKGLRLDSYAVCCFRADHDPGGR